MADAPVIVVTGAGSGIGRAVAIRAAAEGWRVGALDIDAESAAATADLAGPNAYALGADTTEEPSINAALDELVVATGQAAPDAVVCNAGIVRFGSLFDQSLDAWRRVIDVNLTGTFITARAAAGRMRAAARTGAVVATTSINGIQPGPNAGAYGASKAAVGLLVAQMALEWGPFGIRVNAIAPGLIDAGMSEPIYADTEIRDLRAARVPTGRLGSADDIADAVMFLVSPQASYINGAELVVDGGVSRSVISSLPRPANVDGTGSGGTSR